MGSIAKKHLKTAKCLYLYLDGHVVIVHRKNVKVGESSHVLEWVILHEKVIDQCTAKKWVGGMGDTERIKASRLVIHDPTLWRLFVGARRVSWTIPSVWGGGTKTREMGIEIASLMISHDDTKGGLYLSFTPNVLSCGFTFQEGHSETFENHTAITTWNGHTITEVVRAKGTK